VPLSATLKSLWEAARSGVLARQGMNSLELYITGLLLSIAVGRRWACCWRACHGCG